MTNTTRGSPTDLAPAVGRPVTHASPLVRVDVSAETHRGHVRPNNEDQFFVTKLTRTLETVLTSLGRGDLPERAEEVNYVMVVADGMGGHASGEVASRMAISALVSLALDVPDWFFRLDKARAPEIERRARELVQRIASDITEMGQRHLALHGMGTTLTAARSLGRDLMIVHAGDSRAYVLRGGRLHRLTKDHTYAQLLVDAGHLSPRDAADSGVRHILTNVLGGSDEHVEVDVDLLRLDDGDRVLLCTDGLTDRVDDESLARILSGARSAKEDCAELVQLALDRGGRDNITVIVAAYAIADDTQTAPGLA